MASSYLKIGSWIANKEVNTKGLIRAREKYRRFPLEKYSIKQAFKWNNQAKEGQGKALTYKEQSCLSTICFSALNQRRVK